MNLELIWRFMLALPGLVVPGLSDNSPGIHANHTAVTIVQEGVTLSPPVAPTPTRAPQIKHTVVTPPPTPTPRNITNQAPSGSEIASEQQCPGQSDTAQTATVLVCLSSYARIHNGLGGITASASLMAAAVAKDQDMLSCGYSHTACGKNFNYWMTVKGYTGNCTAENIAQGQPTPLAVFEAWMKSPGHRANILNSSYKNMGVAETSSLNGPMWVMELGGC